MGAPFVEAEQDGSIQIQDLPEVVMGGRGGRLTEQRLVPTEAGRDVGHPRIVHVRFIEFSASGQRAEHSL